MTTMELDLGRDMKRRASWAWKPSKLSTSLLSKNLISPTEA